MGFLWVATCVAVLHMIIYYGHFHIIEGNWSQWRGIESGRGLFRRNDLQIWRSVRDIYVLLMGKYGNKYI